MDIIARNQNTNEENLLTNDEIDFIFHLYENCTTINQNWKVTSVQFLRNIYQITIADGIQICKKIEENYGLEKAKTLLEKLNG